MIEYFNNPLAIEIGVPALALGVLLGALLAWMILRRRRLQMEQSIEKLETQVKTQDALQHERETAFEAATGKLARAFSDLANQSLKS
ncbi:MAG: hypothetical protein RLN69_03380, partial [Woeseiaceae bacterium]